MLCGSSSTSDALNYLTLLQWPTDVAMTTDLPIGYIAMNDHSGEGSTIQLRVQLNMLSLAA
jgi:hypothetical protein